MNQVLMIASSLDHILAINLVLLVAQTNRRKTGSRRKLQKRQLYNRSERNSIIDATIHPLANLHWGFVIVDGALHALNEQEPIESFVKFLRYNAPELLKRIIREMH